MPFLRVDFPAVPEAHNALSEAHGVDFAAIIPAPPLPRASDHDFQMVSLLNNHHGDVIGAAPLVLVLEFLPLICEMLRSDASALRFHEANLALAEKLAEKDPSPQLALVLRDVLKEIPVQMLLDAGSRRKDKLVLAYKRQVDLKRRYQVDTISEWCHRNWGVAENAENLGLSVDEMKQRGEALIHVGEAVPHAVFKAWSQALNAEPIQVDVWDIKQQEVSSVLYTGETVTTPRVRSSRGKHDDEGRLLWEWMERHMLPFVQDRPEVAAVLTQRTVREAAS